MSHWNHRVIKHKSPISTPSEWYTVEEVFYNEDGTVWAHTDRQAPLGETIEELRWAIEHMLKALDEPILDAKEPKSPLLYDNLTENQKSFFLKHIWNGVGSDALPIKPPAYIFSVASQYHDFASFRSGTEIDRLAAAKEFLDKAHEMTRKQVWRKRPYYYLMSYIYYWFLKKFDELTWTYSDGPASNWEEFIQATKDYYIQRNKPIPEYLKDAEKIE